MPFETIRSKAKTRKYFFIWVRCNPLKRLNSAKEIQGFFAWISLVFIWFCLAASSGLADGAFARASELGLD
jgi:hypothetical protein